MSNANTKRTKPEENSYNFFFTLPLSKISLNERGATANISNRTGI